MLSRRKILTVLGVALLAVVAFSAWSVWQVQRDLVAAEAGVDRLTAALESGDAAARGTAVEDLQEAAASAADRTDGPWWSAMSVLPLVGDDVSGVRALSASLDIVARDGVAPLTDIVDDLDSVLSDGRVNVEAVEDLGEPITRSGAAFARASEEVSALDSTGYAGALRPRFEDYVDRVADAASALASARTAVDVVPSMIGAEGPRDYLLLFQNNAEIRATGGMPGSWALLHAEDGELELRKQGTAGDFPVAQQPVVDMTGEEKAVYGIEQGIYFQNPGFNPDFPRAAEFWTAHWDRRFPGEPLDGVLALDPVGMSYLLAGTGPVQVGDLTLTTDNLVAELLNKPYLTLDPVAQDSLFQEAARAIFDALTGDVASPVDLVDGLSRAAREGRLLVAPADDEVTEQLAGTSIEGAMPEDDGMTPHVDIDVNDTTGSKMSYYLRYWADVQATSCAQDTQQLRGTMSLSQVIAPSEAALLPDSVTGGGNYGTEPGDQLVTVRLYSPHGGAMGDIKVDGQAVDLEEVPSIDGREVATLAISLTTRDDIVVTWSMDGAPGQMGAGEVGVTPNVVTGSKDSVFESACR